MANEKRKILVFSDGLFLPKREFIDHLIQPYDCFTYGIMDYRDSVQEDYIDAEIIIGFPYKKYLKKAENLKWIQLPSAGADAFADHDLYASNEIILTNASGVYGKPIAEHVFAIILSFNRNLMLYERNRQGCVWNREKSVRDFYGSTLGIIGLGDIGKEVAIRGKAFGAKVVAVKRNMGERPDYVDAIYPVEELEKVLAVSDYLVVALPNTPETQGLLSRDLIFRMKPGAFLVNVGRGAAVDQEALIDVLKEGLLAGAGLDVTNPEPLPQDSPLWTMPNVIITSHSSGFSPGNWSRHTALIEENFHRYMEGMSLKNQVNFQTKY